LNMMKNEEKKEDGKLAPSSMKNLDIESIRRPKRSQKKKLLTKNILRKKKEKKKEDEDATKMVLNEYVATFSNDEKKTQFFVRGGTIVPGDKGKTSTFVTNENNELYFSNNDILMNQKNDKIEKKYNQKINENYGIKIDKKSKKI